MLDAEERAIVSAFRFVSDLTRRFMARGFYFTKATPANLVATVRAKPKANALLIGHVRGDTIRAGAGRLSFQGKLAVPVPSNVGRSTRGKVRKRLLPSEVTKPGRRGFTAYGGTAILQRVGKKRLPVRVLYALVPSAELRERFDHIATARATMLREFPAKARRAIQKAAERARAKAAAK
ncbi:MAG: hypothetical protein DCC71_15440 [Proteobacteria bacterium]|nr:MAG: hypothetical protein DCC71_15440 [Pseudomonadota bacterium]